MPPLPPLPKPAPGTAPRGRPRLPVTYDYTSRSLSIHLPYQPSENRFIQSMIESYLEGGGTHSESVRFAIEVYKTVDLLTRDGMGNILNRSAMKSIRAFCRAILRSGHTAAPYVVATRAVNTWKDMIEARNEMRREMEKETVQRRDNRRIALMKGTGVVLDVERYSEPLIEPTRIDEDSLAEYRQSAPEILP